MTSPHSPPGEVETPAVLSFEGKPIHLITLEDGGVPYFHIDDLCAAVGWQPFVADKVSSPSFPAYGKCVVEEETPEGLVSATVLSPTGVLLWTEMTDPRRGRKITAWAKRTARELCPNPREGDPAMFLSLRADGSLPPLPGKFSGYRSEWYALKNSEAYKTYQREARAADMQEGFERERVLWERAQRVAPADRKAA